MTRLRFIESTGSTNADLLADPHAGEGDWLIAARQSAGRGRQGREWQSPVGNFAGSTLVLLRDDDPPAPTLALATGLALIEAIDAAAPERETMLKWPNDLMLATPSNEPAKLAGILLERAGDRVVAGFGVNLASAPDIPGRATASLNGRTTLQAFAPLIAASMARILRLWRTTDPSAIARAWQARAHPIGSKLTVRSGPGVSLAGRFEGLEPDGALRLGLGDGAIHVIRAADVHLG